MHPENEITAKIQTIDMAEEWAKKKSIKPVYNVKINASARTDMGLVRENNEDKFEIFEPTEPEVLAIKGSLFAVADGMGGHASGQVASEIALKAIIRSYYSDISDNVEESLLEAFKRANSYVFDTSQVVRERNGMGTTCTSIVIRENMMYMAHVGDSRLYRIRDGIISQISEDHSWVAEQVRRGALTEEEAQLSPFKNVITRSLGSAPDIEIDFISDTINANDIFVLCTDGLSGYVNENSIQDTVLEWSPPLSALKLIDMASENGGGDNITVVIIHIDTIEKTHSGGAFRRILGG